MTSIADEKRQAPQRIRLAELLASISLATDLAHDVPAESALRDALLAVELATLAGWSAADISDVYYLALLYHIGCTGAVAAQSRLGGGDDINVRRWMSEADYADRPGMMRVAATKIAPRWGATGWPQGIAGLATAERDLPEALASTAEVASSLSQRLGASPAVSDSLSHAYGRWDGKVFTSLPSGTGLSLAARLVHLVHVAQVHAQVGGIEAADAVVRHRSGSEFDPELAKLWLENSHEISRTLAADSVWDMALEAEPDPHRGVGPSHLDEVSRALADFVDLASQFTRGHSRCVAGLAEAAGKAAGLGLEEVATLRRAGDVHDLGMLGVPNRVWTRRGPLSPVDWERVRMHAYHTQRILGLAPPLRPIADLAAMHHERLDGSGYHRGLQAGLLSPAARILAVTEVYQAMREERAWRPPLAPDEATRQLRNEIAARRLDASAVDAVLTAAGQPGPGSRLATAWPAKLTDREVDVLRVLAVGLPNKQIAVELHVSEATVKTHIINIYGKIGVNTRAGATLFALEHDLLDGNGRVSVGSRRRPAGAGGSGK